MKKALATTNPTQIAKLNDVMKQAGQAANREAARRIFTDHTVRKANNTIRRKIADLALFEFFLQEAGVPAAGLYEDARSWRGVTWGLVESFKVWQLQQGYAISSINGRLSTVRTFARLAAKAGVITAEESILIASVEGYTHKEAKHLDEKRNAESIRTRKGSKKAGAVIIPTDIAADLTTRQPETPQGKRDALLMCLLLGHGLRIGEVAILTVNSFDLNAGTITFYRPKVQKTQTHELTPSTRNAIRAYLPLAPARGIIWRKSCKGTGKLSSQMSEASATRALTKRVELLGRRAGLKGLSAHDERHFWATFEANNNTPINRLMDAGGWSSPAMPLRYIESAHIANKGTARIE